MQKPENQIIVIFGASGDLTKRNLVPSLYDLFNQKLLPEKFSIVGASRSELTDDDFRKLMKKGILEFTLKE
jgi:glucose-6-phosphate 1-dehydrogenase